MLPQRVSSIIPHRRTGRRREGQEPKRSVCNSQKRGPHSAWDGSPRRTEMARTLTLDEGSSTPTCLVGHTGDEALVAFPRRVGRTSHQNETTHEGKKRTGERPVQEEKSSGTLPHLRRSNRSDTFSLRTASCRKENSPRQTPEEETDEDPQLLSPQVR